MKKNAGIAANTFIKSGMLVGLGTGSTVFYFIEHLIERAKQGLEIQVVSSSIHSENQARDGGIPIADINAIKSVDITVDGADEITSDKYMIKGGGGALLREKILATISQQMIVIIDESKRVKYLGKHSLPVEILPFAYFPIINRINQLDFNGQLRQSNNHTPYLTDNGNYIYDIDVKTHIKDPIQTHKQLCDIPGVLETGLFINLATTVLMGKSDGSVESW